MNMQIEKNNIIYVALGSNLEFNGFDSSKLLSNAINAINGVYEVIAVSSKYISPAWPKGTNAPDFINMVIAIRGPRSPFALMKNLLKIERKFGRKRNPNNQNAPRSLDLDIIDFCGQIVEDSENGISLSIPHRRMNDRDFVLLPLFEIAPDWVNPINGQTIEEIKQNYLKQNQQFTAKML